MRALLMIDLQNDFLPGGALAVAGGNECVRYANSVMPAYQLIVASQDWHPSDHLSFASQHEGKRIGDQIQLDGLPQVLWPDHCIENTHGAEFPVELECERIAHIVRKGTRRKIDSYSAFFDNAHRHETGLAGFLNERGVSELHLLGLATDYCVKFTALDARTLGFEVTLHLAGCRAVELSAGDTEQALREMQSAGVTITDC